MASVTDDLAFFGHHAMAALGAGVKKLFGFVDRRFLFHHPPELEQGRKRRDLHWLRLVLFAHGNKRNMALSPPQQRFSAVVYA
jgi:hypothetical protein